MAGVKWTALHHAAVHGSSEALQLIVAQWPKEEFLNKVLHKHSIPILVLNYKPLRGALSTSIPMTQLANNKNLPIKSTHDNQHPITNTRATQETAQP